MDENSKYFGSNNFGERFRDAFRDRFGNVSYAEIGGMIGVSRSAVMNYMSGRIPREETLKKVCEVTGVNKIWLRYGTVPQYLNSSQLNKAVNDKQADTGGDPIRAKFSKLESKYRQLSKKKQPQADPVIDALDRYMDSLAESD